MRRAKLYYLRERHGKAAKIKERRIPRGKAAAAADRGGRGEAEELEEVEELDVEATDVEAVEETEVTAERRGDEAAEEAADE